MIKVFEEIKEKEYFKSPEGKVNYCNNCEKPILKKSGRYHVEVQWDFYIDEKRTISYLGGKTFCEDCFEKLVPDDFTSYISKNDKYDEPHYGKTLEDFYGEPLRYLDVKDLLQFSNHEYVLDNYKNRAVWAYLKELPEDTKIVLFFD